MNWKPEPQFGGFYAAPFEKHGLDVQVREGGVGTPTVQMVATQQVPFGVVSADEIVLNRAQGGDVVALFAVYQTNPQGLMTRASRGFTGIGDIFNNEGTVAMQQGLPYASFLKNKFGFEKVRVVPSPGGDLSMFLTNEKYTMQCFVTSEPLAARKAGIEPKTFLIAEAGYNPYTTVLVTHGDYFAAHPDVVRKVIDAVREGWAAYLADPSKTNEMMHQLNPSMDLATFAESAEAQRPLIETDQTRANGIGSMTLHRWQTLCNQLAELKVVQSAPDAAKCFVTPAHAPATQPQ
ncbi:MAG TPA: ABC transporter substrate-binding protein [Tepidisphaeraceae bacterium]|nr:ABC transporter substrate-binding protein [Tepidisphaeraceae bacterium]